MSIGELDQRTLRILLQKGLIKRHDIEKLNKKILDDSNVYAKNSFNKFVSYLDKDYTSNTKSGYKTNTEKFLKFILSVDNIKDIKDDTKLPQLTKNDVERFFTYLIINEYSPASIRRFKNSLIKYFNFLSQCEYKSPDIRQLPIPKKVVSEINAIRDDEIREIAYTSDNMRNRLLILFMYETGMRRQELIDCKKKYIDFENNIVKIHKDGIFDRVGYFSDEVKNMLLEHIDEWKNTVKEINNNRIKRVKSKGGTYFELKISEYLFQTSRSQQISYSTIFKAIKDTAFEYYVNNLIKQKTKEEVAKNIAQEKIANINTETLRHSKRAYLFSVGKTIEEVQILMGDENRWVVKRYLKMAQKLYPENFRD
ncbi:tyrosine-type recombinase/integrase [Clostridiaceae bacterium M8S5]|nr:tyrosine-type recombinase/integrase [Clostridiaceae bacterium M8S5]